MEKKEFSKEFSDLGEEIRNSVQSAINKGDFADLNREIRESVGKAMNEAKRMNADFRAYRPVPNKEQTRTSVARAKSLPVRSVGKVAGVLFTVFGSISLATGIILLLTFLGVGIATGADMMVLLFWFLGMPFFCAGVGMLAVGSRKRKRLARMNMYVKLTGTQGYCELKKLAAQTGRTVRYVLRDIRKMIRLGMFPEGHIDDQETCFMLDYKTHQLYLEMKTAREQQAKEAAAVEADPQLAAAKAEQEAIYKVVQEGREYIRQIRQADLDIEGVEISAKLNQLSNIMDKIFLYVEGHPEKLEQLHRFMEYYLPTTLKLVNAYREFDGQPVQGENITKAKLEIEETLGTINQAFARLYDNLYADQAMDISTDIDVLQTMFAQEGLTDEGFGKSKERGTLEL